MPLHLSRNGMPSHHACGSRSRLRNQLVDPSPVEPDDHFASDHDRRGPTAVIGIHQFLKSRRILGDVALDKIDPLLRKILFRGVAGASAVGSEKFDGLLAHALPPLA